MQIMSKQVYSSVQPALKLMVMFTLWKTGPVLN